MILKYIFDFDGVIVKSTLTDKICFQRFLDALKIKIS